MNSVLFRHFRRFLKSSGGVTIVRRSNNNKGTTLVEVTVTAILASIMMFGLVDIYTQGIKLIKSSVTQNLMYYEAIRCCQYIEASIRDATSIDILQGPNPTTMTVHLPDVGGLVDNRIVYHYNGVDRTLRADLINRNSEFNKRLLPIMAYGVHNGRGRPSYPYTIKYIYFEEATDLEGSVVLPSQPLVRVRMVLQSTEGDTMAFNMCSVNRNAGL